MNSSKKNTPLLFTVIFTLVLFILSVWIFSKIINHSPFDISLGVVNYHIIFENGIQIGATYPKWIPNIEIKLPQPMQYKYKDLSGTQQGPHNWSCYPNEITSKSNLNLFGFNCNERNGNMTCQLSNGQILTQTAKYEVRNVHYICDLNNTANFGTYYCTSEDGKMTQTSTVKTSTLDQPTNFSTATLTLKGSDGSIVHTVNYPGGASCNHPVIITKDLDVYVRCESGGPGILVYDINLNNSQVSEVKLVGSNYACN